MNYWEAGRVGLRPTSIKTRIETLKALHRSTLTKSRLRPTSIKTRIETTKHIPICQLRKWFKTNIHQNKDWNFLRVYSSPHPYYSFKTNIHQNKDWNFFVFCFRKKVPLCLRPTSIKTRIETCFDNPLVGWIYPGLRPTSIKTRIETILEPNMVSLHISLRPTSIKTRIETCNFVLNWKGEMVFKTNIHQNKDWNYTVALLPAETASSLRPTSIKTRIETIPYSKILKWWVGLRPTSIKTRIETEAIRKFRKGEFLFKTNIHQNKDWNLRKSGKYRYKILSLRPTSIKTRIETVLVGDM